MVTPVTVEFATAPEWHDLFYGTPNKKAVARLQKWLKESPYALVVMYHGAKADYPVMAQGLLPTGRNRRNSLQSRAGRVSLSVYPGHAYDFGKLGGIPTKKVALYRVTIPVCRLVADTDQLRNKRLFGGMDVGSSLADSLVHGSGAQVKGEIPINFIEKANTNRFAAR